MVIGFQSLGLTLQNHCFSIEILYESKKNKAPFFGEKLVSFYKNHIWRVWRQIGVQDLWFLLKQIVSRGEEVLHLKSSTGIEKSRCVSFVGNRIQYRPKSKTYMDTKYRICKINFEVVVHAICNNKILRDYALNIPFLICINLFSFNWII